MRSQKIYLGKNNGLCLHFLLIRKNLTVRGKKTSLMASINCNPVIPNCILNIEKLNSIKIKIKIKINQEDHYHNFVVHNNHIEYFLQVPMHLNLPI